MSMNHESLFFIILDGKGHVSQEIVLDFNSLKSYFLSFLVVLKL